MMWIIFICFICYASKCSGSVSASNITEVRCVGPEVPHGRLELAQAVYRPGDSARLVCREGFQLDGPDRVTCGDEGVWRSVGFPDQAQLPRCRELSCPEPAALESGSFDVEGLRTADGTRYRHGSVAIYRCGQGFQLPDGFEMQRVCTDGGWRGEEPTCTRTGCGRPPEASHGYYLELAADGAVTLPGRDQYPVGARAVYRCDPGHVLVGTDTYQCVRSGEWSPPVAPGCQAERPGAAEPRVECPLPQRAPLTTQRLLRGVLTDRGAAGGAVVEYACTEGTRDRVSPCRPQRATCWHGRWLGGRPHCAPVSACARPPPVAHGRAYGDGRAPGAEVFYTCDAGFRLLGPRKLTCDAGGCWAPPRVAPVCERERAAGAQQALLSPAAVTLLAVTAAVVLLLVLLLALLLQRRAWKPLRRPPPPPPPGPRRPEDADRVALIAYPEGSQYVLPTYEEAIRAERAMAPPPPEVPRLHHHRSLPPAGRRERLWRRDPESDSVSQRSVQSHHSASTRQSNATSNATPSLLDSMGSTDTMATSDAASNTLSANATGSVRAMAGSLASFDTSSVLNTEGVPLLEENETELETAEQDAVSCGKSSTGDTASNK